MFFIRAKHVSLLFLTLTALMSSLSASTAEDDSKAAEERLDSLEARIPELSRRLASTRFPGVKSNVTPSGSIVFGANYHRFTEVTELFKYDSVGALMFPEKMNLGLEISGENRAALSLSFSLYQDPVAGVKKETADFLNALSMIRQGEKCYVNVGLDLPEWLSAMISLGNDISTGNSKFSNQVSVGPLSLGSYDGKKFAWDRLPWMGESEFTLAYESQIQGKTLEEKRDGKGATGVLLQSYIKPADLGIMYIRQVSGRRHESERGYIFAKGRYYSGHLVRLMKDKIADNYLLGLSFHTRQVDESILRDTEFKNGGNVISFNDIFGIGTDDKQLEITGNMTSGFDTLSWGKGFLTETYLYALDFSGPIGNILTINTEFALSVVDSIWYTAATIKKSDLPKDFTSTKLWTYYANNPIQIKSKEHSRPNIAPAIYSVINWSFLIPAKIQLAYIAPGFYSREGILNVGDGFFPFGSNLSKPGTFIEGKEYAPYIQNMAGFLATLQPQLFPNGKSRFSYGYHGQIKKGRDIIHFPHRLNGLDEHVAMLSNWSKWNNGIIDRSLFDVLYDKRLGDESYFISTKSAWSAPTRTGGENAEGPDAGGLRGDYCSIFETFVPYLDSASAVGNYLQTDKVSIFKRINTLQYSQYVPSHRKRTFNASVELGVDAGDLFFKKQSKFFIDYFVSIDGVSSGFMPIAFSEKPEGMQLWSLYTRVEPMVMISKDIGVIGLAGWENWRSQKAWMNLGPEKRLDSISIKQVPIDYRDWALGIGFDWKLVKQIAFYGRFKWLGHEDIYHKPNNFKAFTASGKLSYVF